MDVFFMIRCKNITLFIDTKENSQVLELKKIIEGILKVSPENQRLLKDEGQILEDQRLLSEYALTATTARAQQPMQLGLVLRDNAEVEFSSLALTSYSTPPDLPEVMKSQESAGQPGMGSGAEPVATTIQS